jgi:hypothetical protein
VPIPCNVPDQPHGLLKHIDRLILLQHCLQDRYYSSVIANLFIRLGCILRNSPFLSTIDYCIRGCIIMHTLTVVVPDKLTIINSGNEAACIISEAKGMCTSTDVTAANHSNGSSCITIAALIKGKGKVVCINQSVRLQGCGT